MNVTIAPPQRPTDDEADVALECEYAIDAAMRELVNRHALAYREDPDLTDDPTAVRPSTGFSLAPF